MRRQVAAAAAGAVALAGLGAAPAYAAPPEFMNGLGVCISQVAIQPDVLGTGEPNLGQVVSGLSGDERVTFRADGRGTCGSPPGPGHLQR